MSEVGGHSQVTEIAVASAVCYPVRRRKQIVTCVINIGAHGFVVRDAAELKMLQRLLVSVSVAWDGRWGVGARETWDTPWRFPNWWRIRRKTVVPGCPLGIIAREAAEAGWLIHVNPITVSAEFAEELIKPTKFHQYQRQSQG